MKEYMIVVVIGVEEEEEEGQKTVGLGEERRR